ncbi:MAG: NAD(P)-binding domain-containing protein [Bacteroidota bacterium]
MKVAILGTGSVGQAVANKLLSLGHQVFVGTRDVEDTMNRTEKDGFGNPPISFWIKEHPEVKLMTFKEAVQEGSDLVVFAMNGQQAIHVLKTVGSEALTDKIMMDISNPLDFSNGFPPSLFVSNTDSLGEQIQREFPSLKVVKTLNTMSNPIMVNPSALEGDHTVFMSGNDEGAKAKVSEVLQSFGWPERNIFDLGDISTARGTEMILPIWLRLYGKIQSPLFNFHINTQTK